MNEYIEKANAEIDKDEALELEEKYNNMKEYDKQVAKNRADPKNLYFLNVPTEDKGQEFIEDAIDKMAEETIAESKKDIEVWKSKQKQAYERDFPNGI